MVARWWERRPVASSRLGQEQTVWLKGQMMMMRHLSYSYHLSCLSLMKESKMERVATRILTPSRPHLGCSLHHVVEGWSLE